MTLADRIVILKGGEVEQVGTPDEVYGRPASVFVGGFIGSPAMNFATGTISGGEIVFDGGSEASAARRPRRERSLQARTGATSSSASDRSISSVIRKAPALSGRVQVVEPLGSDTLVHFTVGPSTLTARVAPDMRPTPGETLPIGVDPSRVHLFDAATERALH